jgi:hypothetical protein
MNNWIKIYHKTLKEIGLLGDEEIQRLLQFAVLYDDKITYSDVGELLDVRINEALLKNDPFTPYPHHEDLAGSGIFIGNHYPTSIPFFWGHEDQRYSVLMLGSPGAGKTNLAYWIVEKLVTEGG